MLIITDLRIHLPPPPTGTPPSRRRRMENTIDYQIIIFLINFATKSEKEPLLHESDVYKRQPLCHYTLRTVTNRPEGTFRSLRYTFGGDHPSQTTHQTVSPLQRVRTQIIKGPYFNSDSTQTGVCASKSPAYPTHQLPKFNVKL